MKQKRMSEVRPRWTTDMMKRWLLGWWLEIGCKGKVLQLFISGFSSWSTAPALAYLGPGWGLDERAIPKVDTKGIVGGEDIVPICNPIIYCCKA